MMCYDVWYYHFSLVAWYLFTGYLFTVLLDNIIRVLP
jgi:hypothetical protein